MAVFVDIKVLANAGGVNPHQCAKVLSELATSKGVELSIAVVEGDDLMPKVTHMIMVILIQPISPAKGDA